jgi:hypothetical protein
VENRYDVTAPKTAAEMEARECQRPTPSQFRVTISELSPANLSESTPP